ncbi:MAG: metallophosphoesterase [Treponema sp.]|nr:metallophosphoesterase [Treponema sp.]
MSINKNIKSILLLSVLIAAPLSAQKKADIIFMNDVHSFLKPTARAKTLINRQKEKNPDTFVFDAGDFSMGTLYQTVFSTQAAEYRILGYLGVDATTLGNHEFDYGVQNLADMFDVSRTCGESVPDLVLCNVDWDYPNEYTKILKAALKDRFGCKNYKIIKKGDLNVAVIGVFGSDAFFCAPTCELKFTDQYEAVKKTVAEIKANEKADMIVVLSHGGTSSDPKKSEDEILAKKVPEIDVIISGHTHTKLDEPIIIGNTLIGSCEAYSAYLGNISMTQKPDGRWNFDSYYLSSLKDESIPEDPEMKRRLAAFDKQVDEEYLSKWNLKSNQVLSYNPEKIEFENEVGYLIADAFYNTLTAMGEKVDFTVVPFGCIRNGYEKGPVTVSDVFESFSLGIGRDQLAGYPLIKVYIKGEDLINAAEVDCSMSGMISYVRLFTSGFHYEYNPKRMILNKATKVYITKPDGTKEPVDKNKLYCCITDMYTGQMLGNVLDMTKGLISLVPRTEDGTPTNDYNSRIICTADGTEVKAWYAIAAQIEKWDELPGYKNAKDTQKTCMPSLNPFKLLANPSKLAKILRTVICGIIVIIVAIVLLVKKLKKTNKGKK